MIMGMLKSKKGLEMKLIMTLIILLLFAILMFILIRGLGAESGGLTDRLFDLF